MKHFSQYISECLRILPALVPTLILMASALAGCIEESGVCPPAAGDDTHGLHLRFDIVTRGGFSPRDAESRALSIPSDTETGTTAENFIDIPNLTFLVFDNEQKLLAPFYPTVTPDDTDSANGYTRYEVNAVITDHYFDLSPGIDHTAQVPFYILVLANYSGHSPQGLRLARGMTLEDFFGRQSATFATPQGSPWWFPHPGTLSGGITTPDQPQFIPMAGLQSFAPTVAQLMSGEKDNPFRLDKDINMLRAMAKIEVVDHLDITDNAADRHENSPSIDKVELRGYYSRGTLLPELTQWHTDGLETQYVTAANVPAAISYNNPYPFGQQAGGYGASFRDFGYDEAATMARADGCKVFSAYVPEYVLPATGSNKAWIQVTIKNPANSPVTGGMASEDGGILYELRLAEYPLPLDSQGRIDEDGVRYIPLLRNNIYRYEVISLSSDVINLVWTVCPMDVKTPQDIPPYN